MGGSDDDGFDVALDALLSAVEERSDIFRSNATLSKLEEPTARCLTSQKLREVEDGLKEIQHSICTE